MLGDRGNRAGGCLLTRFQRHLSRQVVPQADNRGPQEPTALVTVVLAGLGHRLVAVQTPSPGPLGQGVVEQASELAGAH